jgi:hypothetical protein
VLLWPHAEQRRHRRLVSFGYAIHRVVFSHGRTLPDDCRMIEYAKPASETEEGRQRLSVYYLALGRFAHRFALAELGVHFVLRHYAGMKEGVARALLSGVRIRDTKSKLSRLHEIGVIPEDKWSDLVFLFDQLSIINSARDDIFHYGAINIAEDDGLVTNAAMALAEDRVTAFKISVEALDNMTADLRKILIHFHLSHIGRPPLKGLHPTLNEILSAPWQYSHQQVHQKKDRKEASSGRANTPTRIVPPQSI